MEDFTLNSNILQTATGSITGDISQLQTAIYSKEVRASIAEALYLLYQEINQLQKNFTMAEKVIYPYTYPTIEGTSLNSADAQWILSFSADCAAGNYTNDKSSWEKFAEINGLNKNNFPDANGDGVVNAEDSALVSGFSAEVGAGNYTNNKSGWNAYMWKKTVSDLQEALQKNSIELAALKQQFVPIVTLTQEEYDNLEEEIDENTLYIIF